MVKIHRQPSQITSMLSAVQNEDRFLHSIIIYLITDFQPRAFAMTLEFLVIPVVRDILFQIIWGDRFEKDLESNMISNEMDFSEIRDRLLEEELVYQLKGEHGSPYLSLTDKGLAVISRLYDIERILSGEDSDTE